MNSVTLPSATVLSFSTESGDKLLEADAIHLDLLLGKAQKNTGNTIEEWVDEYCRLLNEKYQLELTPTHAYAIALKANEVVETLKKNLRSSVVSLPTIPSIPSS